MRKVISVLLTVCMILTVCSAGFAWASAADQRIPGTLLYWAYDNPKKTLTFTGAGAIPDYKNSNSYGITGPQYEWKGNPYAKVVFGEGVTGIGNYAFSSSASLESITIPDAISVLGEGVFYSCGNLKTATVGSGIKNIPKSLFIKCDSLETVTLGNATESIGETAFKDCGALKTVVMPDTLKEIKDEAFRSVGLEKIEFPANLEKIDIKAFSYCDNLSEVVINDNLKTIGDNAFMGCGELKNVMIPPTVETIGNHAFGYISSTKKYADFTITGYDDSVAKTYAEENGFTFNSLGKYYCGEVSEGIEWSFNSETKTLSITGEGSMVTEYTAENLPVYIQRFGDKIEKIVISDDISFISDYAFYNLGESCEVAPLPKGISIGNYSFCNTGMAIQFKGFISDVGENGIGFYNDGVLSEEFTVIGEKFTNVQHFAEENGYNFIFAVPTVTEGNCGETATWKYSAEDKRLEILGSGAMADYSLEFLPVYSKLDVESVVISDEITEIGDCAFAGLEKVNSIEIGPNVKKIGQYALGYTIICVEDYQAIEFAPLDNFTVRGYDNTQARVYAENNNFDFDSMGTYTYLNGTLGDTKWSYDKDSKTLTVSGTGSTGDCEIESLPVFSSYDIEKIVISEGIEEIGRYVFLNIVAKEIVIANSVSSIEKFSFGYVFEEHDGDFGELVLVGGMTVKCYPGSKAIEYANNAGLTCEVMNLYTLPESLPIIVDSENDTIFAYTGEMNADDFLSACEKIDGMEMAISDVKISTGTTLTVKLGDKVIAEYVFVVNGDVNGDGSVNSTDALLILQHTVEKISLEGEFIVAGDVNDDGNVNSGDALNVLQISVELIKPEDLMPTKSEDAA